MIGKTRRRVRKQWESLRDFVYEFLADDPFEMAAATSYYTLLSLTPVVLLAIALGGLWFDRATVQEHVLQQIRSFVGPEAAQALRAAVEAGSDPDHSSFLAIGIVTVLIGASTVFMQVQSALNKIWDVEAKPRRRSILVFLRHRLLSFGMLLGVGFLLVVSTTTTSKGAVAVTLRPAGVLGRGDIEVIDGKEVIHQA